MDDSIRALCRGARSFAFAATLVTGAFGGATPSPVGVGFPVPATLLGDGPVVFAAECEDVPSPESPLELEVPACAR